MNLNAVPTEGSQPALEPVGGADHRVRVAGGAGLDDRGVAIGRDRGARSGRDDGADGGVGLQRPFDGGDRRAKGGVGDGLRRRVDDGHEAIAGEALKVVVDQVARLHRLRTGRLPTGAGEGCLDPRREESESHGNDGPREEDGAKMGRCVAAQPSERAHRRHLTGAARSGYTTERRPQARLRIREAGQAPTTT